MPTLANVQGSSLVPNFTGATGTLLQAFGTKQTRDAQAKAEAQQLAELQKADQQQLEIEQAATAFATGDATQQNAALARIIARDPKIGKAFLDLRDSGTEAQQAAATAEAERGLRQGVKLKRLKTPEAQRKELGRMADIEVAEGRDVTPIMDMLNLPDEELGLAIQDKIDLGTDIKTLAESVAPGAEGGAFSKGGEVIIETSPGVFARSITSFNKSTGEATQKIIPITGQPVSKLGETAGDQTVRAIFEAGGTTEAKEKAKTEAAAKLASEKQRGQSEQQRTQTQIEEGLTSADQLATVNRSIDLLESVPTGNLDALVLRGQRLLGIAGADKTELQANLGTAVLARLKETFGAQFTEREGALLRDFSADFGKSTAGNKALLARAKRLIQRKAQRGIAAAIRNKDFAAARQIQEALDFDVTSEAPPPQVIPTAAAGVPAATAPITAPAAPATPAGGAVMNFDAQGNLVQ